MGEMKRRFNMEANDVMSEDGKIMILKPRYIKIEKKDSGYIELKVSLEPKEGYILHPAFKQRRVGNEGKKIEGRLCDKCKKGTYFFNSYCGAFVCDDLQSVSVAGTLEVRKI